MSRRCVGGRVPWTPTSCWLALILISVVVIAALCRFWRTDRSHSGALYGESPYGYLMTRRIERAMAQLRRGDLSVTEDCFAVGCASLGTFSSRFTELVGVPPSTYRHHAARATAGIPPCVAKQVTRPIRNREAPVPEPQLA